MAEHPPYLDKLKDNFPSAIEKIGFPHDQLAVVVQRERIRDVLSFLRDDDQACFDLFVDLTAVDYLGRTPRFEVVIHLTSIPRRHTIRLKIRLEEKDAEMPSITPIYPAANWFERECYDLYGIRFKGHPNLKRILLYDGFQGHPLRKDYPINRRQPRIPLRKPEVRRSDQTIEPPKRME